MDDSESLQKNVSNRNFRRRTDTGRTEAVLSGEAELRMAVEATGLGIFDYYPLSGELHWTHTAKEHFGLGPDAHINYNVFLVGLCSEDRARVDRLIHQALQGEQAGRFATEYRTIGIEDGRERWISASGQAFFNDRGEAVRFIGTTLDISGRKQREEALLENEQRYRLLFDKSPLPKFAIDLETFRFLEVNDAALSFYGYTREEFRDLTLAEIRTGPEFERFRHRLSETRSAGGKIEGRDRTQHRKKNGEVVDVLVQNAEILFKGRPAMLAVVVYLVLDGEQR